MAIQVALHHHTSYHYDRRVVLSPQLVRLRPAPHCRSKILSYALKVEPDDHFINWQQDPQGNHLARLVFPEKVERFVVEVDLVADMTVINPFDFFLESQAEHVPFEYASWLSSELAPFRVAEQPGPRLAAYLDTVDLRGQKTVDFLVELNQRLQGEIRYLIRMEPGVQTCEETLAAASGSCRDSAWLLVQILRNLGMAARFVSGYLIQLKPDVKSLDGPTGAEQDFTDLHAWAEVYLPGAGWVGLDPTSGLLAGEGHIPLACTPEPASAAPISGSVEGCETEFRFDMRIERVREQPRVTKPYSEEQWERIEQLGHQLDERLKAQDVRLTMGGEPTFVSIDDMEADEWNTSALGPMKLKRGIDMIQRLKRRFAPGGLLHFGQGKWYPGEPLPRWAIRCYWRRDGEPVWQNPELFADVSRDYGYGFEQAHEFLIALAARLGVDTDHIRSAYEDVMYYTWRERRLPANVDVFDSKLEQEEERARLARVFEQGLTRPVGCLLPLQFQWWQSPPCWRSGEWPVRSEELLLIPGDSPMGLRLPLQSLEWTEPRTLDAFPRDPLAERPALVAHRELDARYRHPAVAQHARELVPAVRSEPMEQRRGATAAAGLQFGGPDGPGGRTGRGREGNGRTPDPGTLTQTLPPASERDTASDQIRVAICVEPREGRLHVFMPPVDFLEHFLDLVAAVEATADDLGYPVVIEGYEPPHDYRLEHVKVTPDPGVLEVNVQPAHDWDELVAITTGVYEDAYYARLGTEKFDLDGEHTGTGGGNHVLLGGPRPVDSPFLRRPHLLKSLVGYWHNHPSLSYLFSGKFVGPTSQAPRVDEGRLDAAYELQIAFEQIPREGNCPAWLVDRVFRHLLVDLTGNTHRAEFCIDKLYSPDSASGRLGLVEFRAFEMPPHARMSLTQQLLLRALVARFWETPYEPELVDWQTAIHDRWLLPHFVQQDFADVIEELCADGIPIEREWFKTHFEFRYPLIGEMSHAGLHVELRQAIEPWYVLGEEPGAGYTARYVDSSVERLQVKVQGLTDSRHMLTCNGRKVPLHPTGTVGEYVAGVRYRAWQPPSCLHPTIPVDVPLRFDLLDTWMERSLGGCVYHVGHPGGLNPETFPVNANEAEARRGARFSPVGGTTGPMKVPDDEPNPWFPLTLDLRRGRPAAAPESVNSSDA